MGAASVPRAVDPIPVIRTRLPYVPPQGVRMETWDYISRLLAPRLTVRGLPPSPPSVFLTHARSRRRLNTRVAP